MESINDLVNTLTKKEQVMLTEVLGSVETVYQAETILDELTSKAIKGEHELYSNQFVAVASAAITEKSMEMQGTLKPVDLKQQAMNDERIPLEVRQEIAQEIDAGEAEKLKLLKQHEEKLQASSDATDLQRKEGLQKDFHNEKNKLKNLGWNDKDSFDMALRSTGYDMSLERKDA